jgi:hypothetical protein
VTVLRGVVIGLALVGLLGVGYLVGAGIVGAGDGGPEGAGSTTVPDTQGEEGTSVSTPDVTRQPGTTPSGDSCEFTSGAAFIDGPSSTVETIGSDGGVTVEAVVFPRPDYEGNPWTQWGQGLVLGNGSYLSAIGDHLGRDGNSYIYEFDPSSGSLSMIGDVLSYVEHEPGSGGYGKVHGQMVPGPCGEAYFATYWGTRSDLVYGGSYTGDLLFRVEPETRTISNLGAPVPEHGIPSLAGSAELGLVYGEALAPSVEDDVDGGPFFVYDVNAGEVKFVGPDGPHAGYRNIMVTNDGRALYSIGGGELAVYDPDSNEVTTHSESMSGELLRASTTPASDGRIFGVTDDENALFTFHPDGQITSLGTAQGYTASLALHPDEDRFFYVPEAHGDAWELGTPLIEVNASSGEQTTVVELNPMAEESLGLRLGGTYSIVADPSGDDLYIGMNAGTLVEDESPFGEIVLLIVHLP